MPTSTTVKGLNINELTEAQYDAAVQGGVIGPNELSIITDLSDSIQVSTMPTADAGNSGDILQYVGATDATYTNGYFYVNTPTYSGSSATISQTTGSGLTDLAVDVATFESAEQPSGDETVNFVAASVSESIDPTQFQFDAATIEIDPAVFLSMKTSIYGGDWANVARIYFSYDGDNDSFGVAAFDADNYELGSAGGINPTYWGISVVSGTLPSSGSFGTNLYYTPAGIQWTKGGDTVTLADYGISFTGNPTDGDVLTVAYTAPAISGYAWEQINVQPSSGGGQTIEYDDIDFVYGTDPSDMSLYFELENLPTGDYYFYVKMLKDVNTDGGNAGGYQTNKVSFHWDSSWNGQDVYPLVRALSVSPVLDGDFVGATDTYSAFSTGNQPPMVIFYNSDTANKFALKLANWLLAQLYYIYTDKEAVYKVSKLYGGETPRILTANKIGRYDSISGYSYTNNAGNTTPIVPEPILPNKIFSTGYNVSSFATANNIVLITGAGTSLTTANAVETDISMGCKYGEFSAKIIFNTNGKTEQQILKASGPFAASRVVVNLANGSTYITVDNAAFAALQDQSAVVNVSIGISGATAMTEPYMGVYESTGYPDYQQAERLPIASGCASYVLDTPTINEYKNVVQYVGETDANYTNGYFYEADGTVVTVPASVTCTETSSTGTTITCTGSDAEDLISAIAQQTGWSRTDVAVYLSDPTGAWTYDADGNTLYWSMLGQVNNAWVQYFTFSPAFTTGIINWTTSNAADAHDELQNGAWVQKDVQPGGGLSNDATGNNSLSILGVGTGRDNCVEVGKNANASDSQATVVGRSAQGGYDSTAVGYYASGAMYSAVYGYNAVANYQDGIAYGREAVSNAIGAIQIGKGTNADAGTMKVGLTTDGTNWANIELLTAAGLIPVERLAAITGLADGNYKLRLTITSGVPTLSWVAE